MKGINAQAMSSRHKPGLHLNLNFALHEVSTFPVVACFVGYTCTSNDSSVRAHFDPGGEKKEQKKEEEKYVQGDGISQDDFHCPFINISILVF